MPNPSCSKHKFWKDGWDISIFGVLLIIAGVFDWIWILTYPHYALKVFGTTFDGLTGSIIKYQHPVIHWLLGYGFFRRKPWAFWGYLAYLGIACCSEVTTQIAEGFHSTRTSMIIISLIFGFYVFKRRPIFYRSFPMTTPT